LRAYLGVKGPTEVQAPGVWIMTIYTVTTVDQVGGTYINKGRRKEIE